MMFNHQRPTNGKRMFRMLGCCAALSLIPGAALANDSPRAIEDQDARTQQDDTRSDFNDPATQSAESSNRDTGAEQEQADSQQPAQPTGGAANFRNAFGEDVYATNLAELEEDQIRSMQQQLQEMGYYPGPIDGVIGPQTRRALNNMAAAQFRLSQQMVEQGQIPPSLASTLNIENGTSDSAQQNADSVPQQPTEPMAPQQGLENEDTLQQPSPPQEPYQQGQSEREPTEIED